MLLVGDVGGTNIRLALFEYKKKGKLLKENRFSTKNYSSLISVINEFLKNEDFKIKTACIGVAGPIRENRCKATNIPWIVDKEEIQKYLKIPKTYLLNDLEANAYSISCLEEKDFYVLNQGSFFSKGNRCIIAAGTGLGEAGIYFDDKKFRPFACEGGHTDFGPQNEIEIELLKFLKKKYGHVSYERILSGPGIYQLYEFLIQNKIESKNEALDKELRKHPEPQIIITNYGINKENIVCEKVLEMFISIYGAESGNAALKFFALGGVYIGGGIALRILEKLKEKNFMNSFLNKGRFTSLMKDIPVKVILNDKAVLIGAKYYAMVQKELI